MLKKTFIILIICFIIFPTAILCVTKPTMHKPFEFNILEYFVKFNKDGSTSMTKQITKTEIRNINK